jgi:hypothetical protein
VGRGEDGSEMGEGKERVIGGIIEIYVVNCIPLAPLSPFDPSGGAKAGGGLGVKRLYIV